MGELDPVLHAETRLRIMTALTGLPDGDGLTFTAVQDLLGLTPGNLATHSRRLEEAGYVTVAKAFAGRTPMTTLAATHAGRAAFAAYRAALLDLLG